MACGNQLTDALHEIEKKVGKIRRREKPLLVSVRSGAAFSMPGMMDTVLNLGLNEETVQVWLNRPVICLRA